MGSRRMSSLKMTLPILALCLLLSITTQVYGKPSPKHLLIETEEQAKKTSGSNEDYQWWSNTFSNTDTDIHRDTNFNWRQTNRNSHNTVQNSHNGNNNNNVNSHIDNRRVSCHMSICSRH